MTINPACVCDHPLPTIVADALCETCSGSPELGKVIDEQRLQAEVGVPVPVVPAP